MRFATRKSSDTTVAVLAARLYTLGQTPVAAAEAALRAANAALLADLTKVPLGALILVPEVQGATFTADVRAPDELAASGSEALTRALIEVIAQVTADLSEDAADASRSTSTAGIPAHPHDNTFATRLAQIAALAQVRHNESVAARDATPARFKPLQDDLAALLARTR